MGGRLSASGSEGFEIVVEAISLKTKRPRMLDAYDLYRLLLNVTDLKL